MELLAYALRRQQYRAFVRCLLAEAGLLAVLCILWLWRPVATLWIFLIPYMVTSLALMFGNWYATHVYYRNLLLSAMHIMNDSCIRLWLEGCC